MQSGPIYLSFIRPINHDNVCALLKKVNQAVVSGYRDITLMLSSEGGQAGPGFAAYNQLQMLPIQLTTYNIGSVSSIAAIIFLAGTRRMAVPDATFLFHSPSVELTQSEEMTRSRLDQYLSQLEAYERRIKDVISARTSLQPDQVDHLVSEGKTRDAQFAKKFDIIQYIAALSIPGYIPIVQV
jgi:ATP-dependent Clp protease, protease subunit